ncbi:MAG: DUF3857 domain-containing protein [Firmicutes bacterium]|nr:DUF3857 domain-containing protein [Bacillota bacterium]
MRKIFFLILTLSIIFLTAGISFSTNWKNTPGSESFPNSGALIFANDVKYSVNPDLTAVLEIHEAVKILDETGAKYYSTADIPYSPSYEYVEVAGAKIFLSDGTEKSLSPDAFSDRSSIFLGSFPGYSDMRIKSINFGKLEKDQVIEYTFKVHQKKQRMKGCFWASTYAESFFPILESTFLLKVPEKIKVKYAFQGLENVKPVISKKAGFSEYYWKAGLQPEIPVEPAMPPLNDISARIMATDINSWQEVASWYGQIFDSKTKVDGTVKREVGKVIRGKSSDKDKARAIYNYISKNILYVGLPLGIDGYKPLTAAEVLKRKYGDSQDQAVLFVSMLKAAGIKAYPALVSTLSNGNVNKDIPIPSQFDHVIVFIPFDKNAVWADTTTRTTSFEDLPPSVQGRESFVLDDGRGKFIRTPGLPAYSNRQEIKINAAIDEKGNLREEVRVNMYGFNGALGRSFLNISNPMEIKYFIEKWIGASFVDAQPESYGISEIADLNAPLSMSFSFFYPMYSKSVEHFSVFRVPVFINQGLLMLFSKSPAERLYPVIIGNMQKDYHVEILIPEGFKVKALPANVSILNKAGSYNLKFSSAGKNLVMDSSLRIDESLIPVADYKDFKVLLISAAKTETDMIILEKVK